MKTSIPIMPSRNRSNRKICPVCKERVTQEPNKCLLCEEDFHEHCYHRCRNESISSFDDEENKIESVSLFSTTSDEQSDDELSDELEVYEEPDAVEEREGNDELLLEIVQERMQEWESSDEDLHIDHFFATSPVPQKNLQSFRPEPPYVDPFVLHAAKSFSTQSIDSILEAKNGEMDQETPQKRQEPHTRRKTAISKLSKFTPGENTSSASVSSTASLTPANIAANQWLALAALNMSNMQSKTGTAATGTITP
jgi:hypothetical protein